MAYQIPRGTQDILGDSAWSWQELEKLLKHFCALYNFDEIRTPIFEHTNVFKRENDSSDMVNKEMYTFTPGQFIHFADTASGRNSRRGAKLRGKQNVCKSGSSGQAVLLRTHAPA